MIFKKWSKIEDCPHGKNFIAILKLGWKIKILKVYVHVDNNFLMWRELRTLDKKGIGKWKCIFYLYNQKYF
jgi:hypothetical protein